LWTKESFSDCDQRPEPFEAVAHPFEKVWSNLSFKVDDEVFTSFKALSRLEATIFE
jgi:hypothetical protein